MNFLGEHDSIDKVSNLTQLIWTLHNICRDRGSNPRHPTYYSYKKNF